MYKASNTKVVKQDRVQATHPTVCELLMQVFEQDVTDWLP